MNTEMPSFAPTSPVRTLRPQRSHRADSHARYDRLIRRTASRLAARLPSSVRIEDLVGSGWVGALEALSRATPGQPSEQLDAYVAIRAKGAMMDHLRSLDTTTRGVRASARRMRGFVEDFQAVRGRAPTDDEIAAELGMDLDRYHRLEREIDEAHVEYIEDVYRARVDLPHASATPEEAVARKLSMERIAGAFDALPERLRQVLSLYYEHDCTLAEIGAVLGVTESRVCQLHGEAIARIRAALAVV